MEARLIVIGGKANKEAVALKLPTVIGRSRAVELTVAHPMISRKHCRIFEVDGLLMIRDLGSLNGTVVQGQRVTEAPLCPDDEFTVGPLTFRVEYEYHGDFDSVPDPQLYEGPAQQPEVETGEEAPDFEAMADVPDSALIEALGSGATSEELPDFAAWAEPASGAAVQPQEERAVDGVEELTEFETVEDESAAEEPEPSPPPPLRERPTVEDTVDEPAEAAETSDDDLNDFLKGLR